MSTEDSRTTRNRLLAPAVSVAILVAVLVAAWVLLGGPAPDDDAATAPSWDPPASTGLISTPPGSTAPGSTTPAAATTSTPASPAVPARVTATLALIDAGDWPEAANAPGTQGGRSFSNREGLLPRNGAGGQRLQFQEWDVNPKQRGQGRDAERIVTGSDGSAWYTLDHYRSFAQIRGPSR